MSHLYSLFTTDMPPTEPVDFETVNLVANRGEMLKAIMAEGGDVVAVKAWRRSVKDPVTGLVRERLEFAYCLSMTSLQLIRLQASHTTRCTYLAKSLWRMAISRRPSCTASLPLEAADKVVAFPVWQRQNPGPAHV